MTDSQVVEIGADSEAEAKSSAPEDVLAAHLVNKVLHGNVTIVECLDE